jgi:VWFA-related protein
MLRSLHTVWVGGTAGLLLGLIASAGFLVAQTPTPQDAAPKTDTPPVQTQSPPADNSSSSAEVSTRDTAPSFKVRVNLVLVRVVVRDQDGNVIRNLKKEDFQLFDNRKPQVISSFSVETPESHAVVATPSPDVPGAAPVDAGAVAKQLPQHFVATVFDDVSLQSQDVVSVRAAANRLFDSLPPSDRVAVYSTSGQVTQEFTSDHDALKQSLNGLVPRPLVGVADFHDCPDVSYYQADQIVNFHDAQALAVATDDAVQCAFQGDQTQRPAAQSLAQAEAERIASTGDTQTDYIYRHLEDALRRLSGMPGQRVLVLVSPGFLVTVSTRGATDLLDRANRANVVINTIDARGLYTPDLVGDIANQSADSAKTVGIKSSYRLAAQSAQDEVLAQFADGTGGTFFHNRNDLDHGLKLAVAAPELSYLLAFSPQNLKIDGHYHTLKVALAGKQKYAVQARHGYYAPRTIKDPAEAAKEEIREAIFSQEEIHDVPIELQTQFFKADQTQAKLAVLTRVDLKGLHFRKAQGRNCDDLTFATAIFDENGNFVIGGEKTVEMKLLETTMTRLSHSGLTVKSSFDIKPGTYLVRMVVRDAEGAQMAARNGAVVIPY